MSQKCTKCGTINVNEAKFCKNCGFDMHEVALKKSQEKQHSEDEIRRKNTERELDDYKKSNNNGSSYTPLEDEKTKNNDGIKAFATFIIFAIILILIVRACQGNNQAQEKEQFEAASAITVKVPVDAAYVDPTQVAIDTSKTNEDAMNLAQDPIKYYNEAIKRSPNEGYYYNERGQAYLKIGNIEKANKDAQKACKLGHCGLKEDIEKLERNNKIPVESSNSAFDSAAISKDNKFDLQKAITDAVSARESKNYKKAKDLFTTICDKGNPGGCTALGNLYDNGQGVEEDNFKAFQLYTKSCNLGDAWGCTLLAGWYETGDDGVLKDHTRQAELYTKACKKDNAIACNFLGEMYLDGDGVQYDRIKAKMYFKKGCDLHNDSACKAYERFN